MALEQKRQRNNLDLLCEKFSVKYPTLEIALKILFDDQTEFIKHKRQWINGGSLQKFLLSDSPWNQYGQNRRLGSPPWAT
jgi:hypothetical protein